MNPYLFAYGFLKSRFHGNQSTQTPNFEAKLLGAGLYRGKIYRVASYPGVVYLPNDHYHVRGEIFELNNPEASLRLLDQYEHAHPFIINNPDYKRVLRPILFNQKTIECWVYEYLLDIDPKTEIESGEF